MTTWTGRYPLHNRYRVLDMSMPNPSSRGLTKTFSGAWYFLHGSGPTDGGALPAEHGGAGGAGGRGGVRGYPGGYQGGVQQVWRGAQPGDTPPRSRGGGPRLRQGLHRVREPVRVSEGAACAHRQKVLQPGCGDQLF
jgi:hypothetical protein